MVAFQKQKSLAALVRVLLGGSIELLSTGSAEEPNYFTLSYSPLIFMISQVDIYDISNFPALQVCLLMYM